MKYIKLYENTENLAEIFNEKNWRDAIEKLTLSHTGDNKKGISFTD